MIIDQPDQVADRDPQPFDVCGELPTRTTVLEASAGTGKTYTIAALAARYLAEGVVELSELMMITFGRMATNELRMRVRERLVQVDRDLSVAESGAESAGTGSTDIMPTDSMDDVSRLLCTGSEAELRLRRRRIRAALADFDAATIATTHEFCQTMLDELGVLGDREPDATFTDTLTDLTHEVASDCYLQLFAADPVQPPFTFDEAVAIAHQVINDDTLALVPVPADTGDDHERSEATVRYRFAEQVREQLAIRKARRRLYSYSDMLTRLQQTLHDPTVGELAVARLRDRYAVVLVDEFQDTDPVQWDILRTAFDGHATLILIGDPKQAIYAFRGADVYSYLQAVTEADTVRTLGTNWRSDQALVSALDTLIGGVALGDSQITVRPVTAHHQQRRLQASHDQLAGDGQVDRQLAPVRIRYQPYEPGPDLPRVAGLRTTITRDLVADIAELLSSRALITDGERRRPVRPGDVAVLVRRNVRGEEIRDALAAQQIPAVVLGANSVYAGDLGRQWLTLLTALEQPRQAAVRAVALTDFVGWTMAELATADDDRLTQLSAMIRSWSRVLSQRGVASLLELITTETRLAERVLSANGGERRLTDLRHIGQSLHAAAVSSQLGIGALIDWLRQRIDEAQNTVLDDRSRRLETDTESVQILSVHRSKGLEFPIVYLPDLWDRYQPGRDNGKLLRLHEPHVSPRTGSAGTAGGLVLDVGGAGGPGRRERLAQAQQEDGGDDLRLAYVAFTRAQLQVVTWWMPSVNTPSSALQRFLFRSRSSGSSEPADRYEVGADPGLLPELSVGATGGAFSIEPIEDRRIADWLPEQELPAVLNRRHFDREVDLDWRRTSYSSLTAAAHGSEVAAAGVSSEAEVVKEDDESPVAESLAELGGGAEHGDDPISPMAELPMGAAFGTVVHEILEQVDPRADDLAAALQTQAAEELSRLPAQPMTAEELAAGILPPMQTPLGPLADDLRLCDIASTDRLAELTFELPLAGGNRPLSQVRLGDLAPLLRSQLPPDDPLIDYPDLLAQPLLADQPLRGYLNGSIDAVLRVGDRSSPRYLVVDYKTNWLGDLDQRPLRVSAYRPSLLPVAMSHAHYPLQALLYAVALHRYLRWRQPGYRAEDQLGGVLYLFLRGMAGADTPREDDVPCGVFSWRPPASLIVALSDLLDHGPDDGSRR